MGILIRQLSPRPSASTRTLSKAQVDSEFNEIVYRASTSVQQARRVSVLLAAGAPTVAATVIGVTDTGRQVDGTSNVLLTVESGDQILAATALVAATAIPRVGDAVRIVSDPVTGFPLYAGLA